MSQITGTPVAFINVSDRARAMSFYCDKLGFGLRSTDQFGDFIELGGALMRMTVLPDFKPAQHPVLGWNVAEISAAVAALRARGIAFTIYEGLGQDALGIWTAPDGKSKVAFFPDPDGNVLALSQH